ncbi:MAG: HEAT repeat domain-containing protein, partial [Acidimicrobiales bacterium]
MREAAARWVACHPSPALAEALVTMLDDPQRRCRLAAVDALIRLGATAAEPLVAYLSRVVCPGRALALKVVAGIADGRLLGPGLRAAGDPDPRCAPAASLLAAVAGGRAEQSRAEQSRAEQSRAEQSRAEQSRAEQSRLCSGSFTMRARRCGS